MSLRGWSGGSELAGSRIRLCLLAVAVAASIIVVIQVRHRAAARVGVSLGDYTAFLSNRGDLTLPVLLNPPGASTPAKHGISDAGRAVRVGAMIADLDIVSWARNHAGVAAYYEDDSVALGIVAYNAHLVSDLAGQIAVNLAYYPHSTAAVAMYRRVQQDGMRGATVGEELVLARRAALTLAPSLMALGNFLEAGRVAAIRHDHAFFARSECRAMAVAASELPGVRPDAREALNDLGEWMQTTTVWGFRALDRSLATAQNAVQQ